MKIIGFLKIVGDSARTPGYSLGFSRFLRNLCEVSGVSSPSLSLTSFVKINVKNQFFSGKKI